MWAHTSPVYVRQADQPRLTDRQALTRFIADLDRTLGWVTHRARCSTDKHRAALADVFTAARQELVRRLG